MEDMGTFFHPMTVTGPTGASLTIDALVDTCSTFSSLPRQTLNQIGVVPRRRIGMRLANGNRDVQELGSCSIEVDGLEDVMPIVLGEPESPPVIGAVTLEILLLGVDPVNKILVP